MSGFAHRHGGEGRAQPQSRPGVHGEAGVGRRAVGGVDQMQDEVERVAVTVQVLAALLALPHPERNGATRGNGPFRVAGEPHVDDLAGRRRKHVQHPVHGIAVPVEVDRPLPCFGHVEGASWTLRREGKRSAGTREPDVARHRWRRRGPCGGLSDGRIRRRGRHLGNRWDSRDDGRQGAR